MCGIAGYAGWERDSETSRSELKAMCDAIVHRGPDEAGYHVAPGIALGMRRLSIIDLAGGSQPIGNEAGNLQIVFNGEIYNYRELRRELEQRGHQFASATDTETIVHLYEELGTRAVERLRGMFAFAIWDADAERLVLARDRLGIKPLYYWEADGGIAFASELRSLLQLKTFPRRIRDRAVTQYLAFGYVPDPDSIFEGVLKLEPGHTLVWTRETGARVSRYWSPVRPERPDLDEHEAATELRRLLEESVRYRLIADVPLGAFLSGGTDSSAVVAAMTRYADHQVRTFSIGFDAPEYNEAPHAAAVARALGTDHRELIVRPDAEALFERIATGFDEPFADSSAIPTFLVSQLARETVTVALSGDGGDELFGGYTRYLDVLSRSAIPIPGRRLLGALARRLPHGWFGRNRLIDLSRSPRGRFAGTVTAPLAVVDGGVLRRGLAELADTTDTILDRWFDQARDRDFPTQMMLVDLMSYLPGDILTKVDRMSMAVSLEARVPILDHHVVEFATTLPSRLKLREGRGKWIFRQAIADLVPDTVLEKPKQGFAMPLKLWFRNELRHRVTGLTATEGPTAPFLDRAAVSRLLREHDTGRRDHSTVIWRLLVLRLWLENLEGTSLAPQEERSVAATVAERRA